MKKTLILLLLCSMMLNSCMSTYGIRGNYDFVNKTITETSYDDVWSKVIDFFAENSVPIGTISKESGLITANNVNFGNSLVCVEDRNGIPERSNAWFVLPYKQGAIGGRASCSFNVRIKSVENGKTYIEVNISNIVGYYDIEYLNTLNFRKEIIKQTVPQEAVSTGLFEKSLLNTFK